MLAQQEDADTEQQLKEVGSWRCAVRGMRKPPNRRRLPLSRFAASRLPPLVLNVCADPGCVCAFRHRRVGPLVGRRGACCGSQPVHPHLVLATCLGRFHPTHSLPTHCCRMLTRPIARPTPAPPARVQLQRALGILGVSMSREETALLITEIDTDGNGEVGASPGGVVGRGWSWLAGCMRRTAHCRFPIPATGHHAYCRCRCRARSCWSL